MQGRSARRRPHRPIRTRCAREEPSGAAPATLSHVLGKLAARAKGKCRAAEPCAARRRGLTRTPPPPPCANPRNMSLHHSLGRGGGRGAGKGRHGSLRLRSTRSIETLFRDTGGCHGGVTGVTLSVAVGGAIDPGVRPPSPRRTKQGVRIVRVRLQTAYSLSSEQWTTTSPGDYSARIPV